MTGRKRKLQECDFNMVGLSQLDPKMLEFHVYTFFQETRQADHVRAGYEPPNPLARVSLAAFQIFQLAERNLAERLGDMGDEKENNDNHRKCQICLSEQEFLKNSNTVKMQTDDIFGDSENPGPVPVAPDMPPLQNQGDDIADGDPQLHPLPDQGPELDGPPPPPPAITLSIAHGYKNVTHCIHILFCSSNRYLYIKLEFR